MPPAPPKSASAVLRRLPEPVRRRVCSATGRRMARYAPAAMMALAASQLAYLLCGSVWHLTGRVTGAAGWLACAWLVSDVVFKLLIVRAGVEPLAWSAVSVAVAAVVSFAGNRYWTFRQRQRTTVHGEGLRYVVLTGAGLMIQLACVRLTIRSLGPDTALMLALGLSLLFSYWSCRTWVWRALPPAPAIIA